MSANLSARLRNLEQRCSGKLRGPALRITYSEGAARADIEQLQADALAAYVAERGAVRGEPLLIHRVIVDPPRRLEVSDAP